MSPDNDRIIGIKFEVNTGNCIYFIQVYLPCSKHSIEVYREYVDKLQNILYLFSEKGIIMIGDFNLHLPEANSGGRIDNRSLCFNSLLRENNIFSINTSQLCTGPRCTFVTYDGRHILIPEEISEIDGWLRMGLPPPPPREFGRHILSCRKLKAESFKKCLHSVRWSVSLQEPVTYVTLSN